MRSSALRRREQPRPVRLTLRQASRSLTATPCRIRASCLISVCICILILVGVRVGIRIGIDAGVVVSAGIDIGRITIRITVVAIVLGLCQAFREQNVLLALEHEFRGEMQCAPAKARLAIRVRNYESENLS
jgi:hypothetical protein